MKIVNLKKLKFHGKIKKKSPVSFFQVAPKKYVVKNRFEEVF